MLLYTHIRQIKLNKLDFIANTHTLSISPKTKVNNEEEEVNTENTNTIQINDDSDTHARQKKLNLKQLNNIRLNDVVFFAGT